jgi:hypothetical protein
MATINQRELARRLVRLRSAVDRNILCLNYGGCGVFAALAAKALKDLKIAEVEIILPDPWNDEHTPRSHVDAGNAVRHLSMGHVGVRYILDGVTYCMDSTRVRAGAYKFGRPESDRARLDLNRNGAHEVKVSYPFGQGLTLAEFAPVAFSPKGWNRSFDRAQIPLLRSLVTAYLVHDAV